MLSSKMKRPIITLTSDFGVQSQGVGIMEGVALEINPEFGHIAGSSPELLQDLIHQVQALGRMTILQARAQSGGAPCEDGALHVAEEDKGIILVHERQLHGQGLKDGFQSGFREGAGEKFD